MAEFSRLSNEITHERLTDGGINIVALGDGYVTVGRSGTFYYYHFTCARSAYDCRILAQSSAEIRIVWLLQGEKIQMGCAGLTRTFSVGDCNCAYVRQGCAQDIAMESEGGCELFMLVVGRSDSSLSIAQCQPHFRDFLGVGECAWLFDVCNLTLSTKQAAVIQQLLHERKPTYLQLAYTQLKLAELLVLFLEKAGRFGSNDELSLLRPDELERIRMVRDMLYDHPDRTYSLLGLARAVGTNEASLKKNFKAVYGTTVFGYLTACRMERARILLSDGRLKVAAVAQEVGYKYASHFSVAFRKYFGYLPTQLLRVFVSMPAYVWGTESAEFCAWMAIL